MSDEKLPVQDFYQQFHGTEHHNDAGDHTRQKWWEMGVKGPVPKTPILAPEHGGEPAEEE